MKLELKAFNVIFENWGDDIDDFFLNCQIDIGYENKQGAEVYSLDVISSKRLSKIIKGTQVEIGKGYFITNDYSKITIIETVKRIINTINSTKSSDNQFFDLEHYFRSHD